MQTTKPWQIKQQGHLTSALLIERRLAILVGHLKSDFRHLSADLIHYRVDLPPHRQIVGAPRRHAAQMRQNDPGNLVDDRIKIRPCTNSRCFSAMRRRSSAAFAFACSASAAARGDCCRSRRKYRR